MQGGLQLQEEQDRLDEHERAQDVQKRLLGTCRIGSGRMCRIGCRSWIACKINRKAAEQAG